MLEAIEFVHSPSPDSLWWNFENALGKIDHQQILHSINTAMDDFGMPNERENPSQFHKALNFATGDLDYIKKRLPDAFSSWVKTLESEEDKRPFADLIDPDASFMNFNYTEFLTTVYGVPREHIFYPHGCREYDENLILGHAPGSHDTKLRAFRNYLSAGYRKTWSHAQGEGIAKIRSFRLHTTKNAVMIIAENNRWFKDRAETRDFVVIGHSLSKVDYMYFQELIESNNDIRATHWYITFYEPEKAKYRSKSIVRIKEFRNAMGLNKEQIILIRLGNNGAVLEVI